MASEEKGPSLAAAALIVDRLAEQAKWLVRVSEWGFADGDLDDTTAAALISRSRARQQWYVRDEDFAALEPLCQQAAGQQRRRTTTTVERYRLADVLGRALRRHGPAGLFEKVQDSREAFKLCPSGCTPAQYRKNKLRLHASYWRRAYELECARHDPDLVVERSRDAVRAELRGHLEELKRRWKVYEQELADLEREKRKSDDKKRECVQIQIEIMYEQGKLHRFEKILRQIRGEEDEEEEEELAASKNSDGAKDEASGGVASSTAQSKKQRRPTDTENERNGFGSAAKKSKTAG